MELLGLKVAVSWFGPVSNGTLLQVHDGLQIALS